MNRRHLFKLLFGFSLLPAIPKPQGAMNLCAPGWVEFPQYETVNLKSFFEQWDAWEKAEECRFRAKLRERIQSSMKDDLAYYDDLMHRLDAAADNAKCQS